MNADDRLLQWIAATKRVPGTRPNRSLYLFVFAVALVSIIVVAVAWQQAILNPEAQERRCGGGYDVFTPVAFTIMQSSGNWTLTSTCTNKDIHLSEVTITIWDLNGTIADPMRSVLLTNLAQANWATYSASYVKVGSEDYVRQAARIIIDATRYRSGYRCELATFEGMLFLAVLR